MTILDGIKLGAGILLVNLAAKLVLGLAFMLVLR